MKIFVAFAVNTTGYTVKEMDKTVLLLVYLMFMEVNITAQANFSCYLWLAKWLNEEKIVHEPDKAMHWIQGSTKLLDWSRRVFTLPNYQQHFQQCQVITPQTALFTCSSLIIQYLKKQPSNMSCIQDVIDAYKVGRSVILKPGKSNLIMDPLVSFYLYIVSSFFCFFGHLAVIDLLFSQRPKKKLAVSLTNTVPEKNEEVFLKLLLQCRKGP